MKNSCEKFKIHGGKKEPADKVISVKERKPLRDKKGGGVKS